MEAFDNVRQELTKKLDAIQLSNKRQEPIAAL
jgi:hypothetical protein